jgi:TPR repeat protein
MKSVKIGASILLWLSICSIGTIGTNQSSIAQTTYPVTSQSSAYPLKTQISPATMTEIESVFKFGKFDRNRAISWRIKLQPLANNNDPVACFLLAKTYDWDEFGIGQDSSRSLALKWYEQAANLNYFPAAYFLYRTYLYEYMGVKTDYAEAIKWLNKSLLLASIANKADVLLEFARLSSPDRHNDPPELARYIPKSMTAHLTYLERAFKSDPHNITVVDWYGERLYTAKRYHEALQVLSNSDNAYTWKKVGLMYERGEGTSPNLLQAMVWYKKMAIDGKQQENDLNPISEYGKREIYRLVCLKKITTQQAAPVYTPEDYREVFGRWADRQCNYSPG